MVGWLVEKYRTERSETRGRHTEEVECEGEKILTCIPRYVRRLRTLVRLLLLSPPLSHVNPSNSRGLFQGLAAWLFVPATQTQFAFRPLSFLHDTLLRPSLVVVYVSSRFLLFFGLKRISNFLFPWKRYSTLDEYPKHRASYAETRERTRDSITNYSNSLFEILEK